MIADPLQYWTERYRRQGEHYVAKGGRADSSAAQIEALTPFLEEAVRGERVLDFGCGPGRWRPALSGNGAREYVGVDLIPGLGTEPLGHRLPRGFDTAAAIFVLQHMTDEADYRHWVRELYLSLKLGGRLVVVDHAPAEGMEGHMAPRGIEGLLRVAPWRRPQIVAEWDGHWCGWLERDAIELPAEAEPAPLAREKVILPQPGADAIVLGGAHCVWEDVRALEEMLGHPWQGIVIAVNDIGCHWPRRLDHWTTLHPEKLPQWRKDRTARKHPDGYITWGRRGIRGIDRAIDSWAGGSSGLLGVTVAYALNAGRVVLCGIPMNRDPHFEQSTVHPKGKPWTSCDAHWKAWTKGENVARMRGRVRSMSGRTRDLLGAPDPEWLGILEEAVA